MAGIWAGRRNEGPRQVTSSNVLVSWLCFHPWRDPCLPHPQYEHVTYPTDELQFFAETWQAAGSARMWAHRIPGSCTALPNLRMLLQKLTCPPQFFFSPCYTLSANSRPGLFKHEVQGWLQRRVCVSQKFPRTKKVKRVSSRLEEPALISTLCSSTLLSLPIFSLCPTALF